MEGRKKLQIINLIILGEPKAKQSFRFTRTGIKYQPREVIQNQNNIHYQIAEQLATGFIPTDRPIIVKSLIYVFPVPKSFTKKQREALRRYEEEAFENIIYLPAIYKTTKPDLTDNLSKMLFDVMQGIVYKNDSQICAVQNSMKIYGSKPRTEVIMEII